MNINISYNQTHLSEPNRINLACDYLVHEFRKIFPNLTHNEAYKAIKSLTPSKNRDDVSIRDFWNLFCAVSSGWRLKDLFNIVTNESIQWRKEKKSIKLFVPKDPLGWMKHSAGSNDFFEKATEDLRANPNTLKEALEESRKERRNRADGDEDDPVIAKKINNRFEVRDGSSRLKLKIEKWLNKGDSSSPPEVEAWIGYPTDGESNFWIPTSSLFFIKDYVFNQYKVNHVDTERFLLRISKLAVVEYNKRVKS